MLTRGRPREGGAFGYLLCERCNNYAGQHYDLEFGRVWSSLGQRLFENGKNPPLGGPHVVSVENAAPGAFVRSILSGMMGICPALRENFPVLQEAVERGAVVSPPIR